MSSGTLRFQASSGFPLQGQNQSLENYGIDSFQPKASTSLLCRSCALTEYVTLIDKKREGRSPARHLIPALEPGVYCAIQCKAFRMSCLRAFRRLGLF